MARPIDPRGYPAGGWILAVIEDEAIVTDVDRTIALWVTNGLDANVVWYELTRERRRYASWGQVRGWMLRWARRDHRLQSAQLSLPGFGRAA